MKLPKEHIRHIELKRRKIVFLDWLLIGFLGIGLLFFVMYLFTNERTAIDFAIIPFFSILWAILILGCYKSVYTTEAYHVSDNFIEVESVYRGKSRMTKIEKSAIRSIKLKTLKLHSLLSYTVSLIIGFRIAASFGRYDVPIIDCGNSYYFLAKYYNLTTRKWIITELEKEIITPPNTK